VTAEEKPLLHDIQKLLSTPLEQVIVEGFELSDARARRGQPHENRRNSTHRHFHGGQPRHSGGKAAGFKHRTAGAPHLRRSSLGAKNVQENGRGLF
jgi:hypothetical protein